MELSHIYVYIYIYIWDVVGCKYMCIYNIIVYKCTHMVHMVINHLLRGINIQVVSQGKLYNHVPWIYKWVADGQQCRQYEKSYRVTQKKHPVTL